jgi:hypothetical protein
MMENPEFFFQYCQSYYIQGIIDPLIHDPPTDSIW